MQYGIVIFFKIVYTIYIRGYNLVVECHASDLIARVRFSLPAPMTFLFELIEQIDTNIILKRMVYFFVARMQ